MHCSEVIELIDSFLSDQLLVETNHDILHHLAGCARCRAELDDRRRLRERLRSALDRAPHLQASPDFIASIAERTRSIDRARRQSQRSWRTVLAVAAALAFVVGSIASQQWLSTWRMNSLTQAAAGDHRDCALQFRLSERPISLEDAARRFDPLYRRFASVEPVTDRLARGRLTIVDRHSCLFQGRRFAHLVLNYDGELVSVLVPVGTVSVTSGITSIDGERVLSFQAGRLGAFVVSTLSDNDLHEVTATIQGPLTRALTGA